MPRKKKVAEPVVEPVEEKVEKTEKKVEKKVENPAPAAPKKEKKTRMVWVETVDAIGRHMIQVPKEV